MSILPPAFSSRSNVRRQRQHTLNAFIESAFPQGKQIELYIDESFRQYGGNFICNWNKIIL